MTSRRTVLLYLCVTLGVAGFTFASDSEIRIEILEGSAARLDGSRRVELVSGELITPETRVRIEDRTVILFSTGELQIQVFGRGTYQVAEILSLSRKLSDAGVRNALVDRFGQAIYDFRDRILSILQPVEPAPSLDIKIQEGLSLLSAGRYTEAYSSFLDIYTEYLEPLLEETPGNDAEQFILYTEFVLSTEYHRDLRTSLQDRSLDLGFPPIREAVLVYAYRLLENFAFRESLEVLEWYIREARPDPEEMQFAFLLKALNFEGMGNIGTAAAYLREAVSYGADTVAGRIAFGILGSL